MTSPTGTPPTPADTRERARAHVFPGAQERLAQLRAEYERRPALPTAPPIRGQRHH
ncbi:hypothetical protein ACFV4F_37625 [Kitasatospora sp. NPDC059722]|uniref:hypothetical protein n=1 Tax=unclassified Kitasatospora TaxID=2633591 RepID=UPI0036599604